MAQRLTIKAPDIGVDGKVDVIEVLVAAGDELAVDQSVLTLESEKASMEVPSSHAGKVVEVLAKEGDKLGSFDDIAVLEVADEAAVAAPEAESETPAASVETPAAPAKAPAVAAVPAGDYDFDVLVLGSGPGGYAAAFRAADLGLKVCMVERHAVIGGVCLNVGCIPSKALLHTAKVIEEAGHAGSMGVSFGAPQIDLDRLRAWKSGITGKLNKGLDGLAKARRVEVAYGKATFVSDHAVRVAGEAEREISFASAIIACGSRPIIPPPLRIEHPALVDSTGALELRQIPQSMLVVGGGIIGLEMATVYAALGSKITVVEMSDQLIPEADADVVQVLAKRLSSMGVQIKLGASVAELKPDGERLAATLGDGADGGKHDCVLVATGRAPNGREVGAEAAGVEVDERGFILSDARMRTNVAHIYAIGDVRGQPMLAHKATHEGKVAAEVIAGEADALFDARCIPSVAYTDPEIAWVGLTERQAKERKISYEKAVFPFAASGKALSMERTEGMTKLLFSKDSSKRLLGAAVVCPGAGDLIAEATLAIEMGANAEDMALSIHPHPTLSETVNFAAEIAEGTITDLYLPKR